MNESLLLFLFFLLLINLKNIKGEKFMTLLSRNIEKIEIDSID